MKRGRLKNLGLIFHKPLSKIQEGLYLGDVVDASNRDTLNKHGIKYVLNVTKECPVYHPNDFVYKRVDLYDVENSNLFEHFPEISDFIKEGRAAGGVFVHCAYGISRSTTSVLCYMIKEQGFTYAGARAYVERRRPIIYPNHGFVRQLKRWERLVNHTKIGAQDDIFAQTTYAKMGNLRQNNTVAKVFGSFGSRENFYKPGGLRGKTIGLKHPSLPAGLAKDKIGCTMNNYFEKVINQFDNEDVDKVLNSKFGNFGLNKGNTQQRAPADIKKPNFNIRINPNAGLKKFTKLIRPPNLGKEGSEKKNINITNGPNQNFVISGYSQPPSINRRHENNSFPKK